MKTVWIHHISKLSISLTLGIVFWSVFSILTVEANSFSRPSMIEVGGPNMSPTEPWLNRRMSERKAIKNLFSLLESSKTAQTLIAKAHKQANKEGANLFDIIEVGEGSMLDTTLVRRFSRDDPSEITYVTRSKIYINRSHSVRNALLDLAHELTHYVFREPFNPYEKNFSASEFVRNTVEGKGGEVEAYLVECQVLKEVYPRYFRENSNCSRIVDSEGRISRKLAVEQFYRVGAHIRTYQQKIKEMNLSSSSVPKVSKENSQFISSAWSLPYPVAALKEYQVIMERVCENDQKRLTLLENNRQRSIASENGRSVASYEQDTVARMMATHRARCSEYLSH